MKDRASPDHLVCSIQKVTQVSRWAIVSVTLAVVLAVAAGTFYLVVFSGFYNVAASPRDSLVAWTLSTTMQHR